MLQKKNRQAGDADAAALRESTKYSIIIPAYNEARRIGPTLDLILEHIEREDWRAEVLIVNDGSRDRTAEIVRRFMDIDPAVRLVENPGNRGKGFSVRNGVMQASGDILLFSDADLSAPIYEAWKLFAAIETGADVAVGSRWLRKELQVERQPVYRQFLGRMFNLTVRAVLGLKQRDTQCGFKAFTRAAAQAIFSRQQIDRWGFDAETLFIAQKLGLKVVEVPVEWAHDRASKIHPVRDGSHMFVDILKIRWRHFTGKYDRVPEAVEPLPVLTAPGQSRTRSRE